METINHSLPSDIALEVRSAVLFEEYRQSVFRHTDHLFAWLMIFQWFAGIAAAVWISPQAWAGQFSQVHIHVYAAIFLGGMISLLPAYLGFTQPGVTSTRYVIAVAQMLTSALLIHLSGGRIETHFHVFGSLAFLAFYRDWKVLIPATLVVALDHWARGAYWPQSVYGVIAASPWRWLEHSAWVLFEDVFLVVSCQESVKEMLKMARRTAELENTNQIVEERVGVRTRELVKAKERVENEIAERKKLEEMVIRSEKMAAVGQLSAGIAHEINNPVGFIGNNLSVLAKYVNSLVKLVDHAEKMREAALKKDSARADQLGQEMTALEKGVNLAYIRSDVDVLLSESQEGIERIKKIVNDLKIFSRSEDGMIKREDLHAIVDGAINIVWNEIKYKAELKKEYGPLTYLQCNAQQIGQVIINLLINAVQAVPDQGVISIRTYSQNGWVCIEIKDNGPGISKDIISKIFDPFFTTKAVGKGTGLGLSISHEIIKKHRGKIEVQSQEAKGSVFTVFLPLI